MEVHFDNIKENIINEINCAKFSIYVCVAWVSENFIIKELTNCLKLGIQVELLVNYDDKFDYSKHKFEDFISYIREPLCTSGKCICCVKA